MSAGAIGTGIGVNAFAIRETGAPWIVDRVKIEKLPKREDLAIATAVTRLDAATKDLFPVLTLAGLSSANLKRNQESQPSLLPPSPRPEPAWAMVIDNAACIGLKQANIRRPMAFAGFSAAAFAYALEWYSAALAYPYDSGARPTLNSWAVFLLFPFELGILMAGITGFIAFLIGASSISEVSGAQQIADLGRSNEGSGLTSGWIERFLYTSFHYRNSDERCPRGCRLI
jgi:hypothetical protein